MKRHIINIALMLFVVGCNGSNEKVNAENPEQKDPIDQTTIYTENIFRNVMQGTTTFIPITSLAQSPTDEELYVTSVTSIDDPSNPNCKNITITNNGFTITSDIRVGTCAYQYQVAVKTDGKRSPSSSFSTSNNAKAIAFIAVQPDAVFISNTTTMLMPIVRALHKGHADEVIDIQAELGTHFPTGASIDASVLVLGDGTATVDTATNKITYAGGSKGVTRLLYSLTGTGTEDNGVIYVGAVDISVSAMTTNTAPAMTNFTFSKKSGEKTREREEVEIDIADYLQDPDGDSLQITSLNAFNGQVEVSSKTDLTNTKFKFQSSVSGVHYVAVTVSDHNGGFVVGLVKIEVSSAFPVLTVGELAFLPPLTLEQVVYSGFDYTGFYTETATTGPEGKVMPTFDHYFAEALCRVRGGVLPNRNQWLTLTNTYSGSFWVEGNDESLQKWPTGQKYIINEVVNDTVSMADLSKSGAAIISSEDRYTPGYITCIDLSPKELVIDIASNMFVTATMELKANYKTLTGVEYPYVKPLIWTSSDPSILSIDDGIATGVKGGKVVVTASSIDGSLLDSAEVEVIENLLLTRNNDLTTSSKGLGGGPIRRTISNRVTENLLVYYHMNDGPLFVAGKTYEVSFDFAFIGNDIGHSFNSVSRKFRIDMVFDNEWSGHNSIDMTFYNESLGALTHCMSGVVNAIKPVLPDSCTLTLEGNLDNWHSTGRFTYQFTNNETGTKVLNFKADSVSSLGTTSFKLDNLLIREVN